MISAHLLPSQMIASRRLGFSGGGHSSYGNIVLGSPGRCPRDPSLVTLIFDNSGSVSSGNDPIGSRYIEAALAVDAVARRCRCDRELIAIVHFDTPTQNCVSPTSLTRQGLSVISKGLEIPTDGRGSSTLGPSLRRAYSLADEYPGHQHVLMVASDFELFDSDVGSVLRDLCAFPGAVHAVVLHREPPSILSADDGVTVTRIDYGDPPGAVARAIFESLTLRRRS